MSHEGHNIVHTPDMHVIRSVVVAFLDSVQFDAVERRSNGRVLTLAPSSCSRLLPAEARSRDGCGRATDGLSGAQGGRFLLPEVGLRERFERLGSRWIGPCVAPNPWEQPGLFGLSERRAPAERISAGRSRPTRAATRRPADRTPDRGPRTTCGPWSGEAPGTAGCRCRCTTIAAMPTDRNALLHLLARDPSSCRCSSTAMGLDCRQARCARLAELDPERLVPDNGLL